MNMVFPHPVYIALNARPNQKCPEIKYKCYLHCENLMGSPAAAVILQLDYKSESEIWLGNGWRTMIIQDVCAHVYTIVFNQFRFPVKLDLDQIKRSSAQRTTFKYKYTKPIQYTPCYICDQVSLCECGEPLWCRMFSVFPVGRRNFFLFTLKQRKLQHHIKKILLDSFCELTIPCCISFGFHQPIRI